MGFNPLDVKLEDIKLEALKFIMKSLDDLYVATTVPSPCNSRLGGPRTPKETVQNIYSVLQRSPVSDVPCL